MPRAFLPEMTNPPNIRFVILLRQYSSLKFPLFYPPPTNSLLGGLHSRLALTLSVSGLLTRTVESLMYQSYSPGNKKKVWIVVFFLQYYQFEEVPPITHIFPLAAFELNCLPLLSHFLQTDVELRFKLLRGEGLC